MQFLSRLFIVFFLGFIFSQSDKVQAAGLDSLKVLLQNEDSIAINLALIEKEFKSLPDSSFIEFQKVYKDQCYTLNEKEDRLRYAYYFYFIGYWYFQHDEDVDAIKNLLSGMQFIKGYNEYFLEYRYNYFIAMAYSRVAYITQSVSLYQKGLSYYKMALSALPNQNNNAKQLIELYTLIGHAYHGVRQVDSSEMFYKKSELLANEIKDDFNATNAMLNQGNLFFRYKNLVKAKELTRKALRNSDSLNIDVLKAYSLLNLSLICYEKEETDSALFYIDSCYKSAQKANHLYLIFRTNQVRATIYKNQKLYNKSALYYKKCVKYLKSKNEHYKLKSVYKNLSDIYSITQNHKQASFYQEAYININDSLTLNGFNKKISLAESLYEHETIMFENKLLDNENKLRKTELAKSKLVILLALAIVILLIVFVSFQIKVKNIYRNQNKIIKEQSKEILQKNEDLKEYKKNLEKLVEERTEVLWDALRHAEESNDFKNAFLRNLSHEIRTPLNAILGFSRLIDVNNIDDIPDKVNVIKNNGHELLNTVDKIIEVARLETEEQCLDIVEVNAATLNKELLKSIEKTIQNSKQITVTFKHNLCDFEGHISTDIDKLKRIVFHLIDNAFKFTEMGFVQLSTSITENKFELQINDTGFGIGQEHIEAVFHSFHKVDTIRKLSRGMGVGLSIVDRFVKALNGEIKVKSELKKGTQFLIELPRFLNKNKA